MSKQELLKFVAPLSMEERRELREILDAVPPKFEGEDALEAFFAWQDEQPPLNLPRDFGINHDHYIHGAPKREDLEP